MKALLLLTVATLGIFKLHAEEKKDWRDSLNPVVGQPWLPMPEGRAVYHFGWSGFQAAEAELDFTRNVGVKTGIISRMKATGRTVGAARLLFRIDALGIFLANVTESRPIRTRLLEQYGSRDVVSGLEFRTKDVIYSKNRHEEEDDPIPPDLLEHRVLDRDDMRKLTGKKGKRFKFPGTVDLQSALLYLRAQPLRPGDERRFVVFHENSPYYVKIKVGKPEKLTIPAGQFRAIPFTVKLEWVDKKERLRKHKNFRSATGWFSDDPARLLLKVESEVFVGKIWTELVSFAPKNAAPTAP